MTKANKKRIIEDKINYLKEVKGMTEKDVLNFNYYDKTDKSANTLTTCIIDFIKYNRGQAERINTMGRRIDKTKISTDVLGYKRTIGSVEWQKGTGTKGSADISATIPMVINNMKIGVSVKIEVKWAKDRQSDDQKKYESKINDAGGIYYIARNMDEFIQWYDELLKNKI